MQSELQQEPLAPLAAPSSHCSPESRAPLPQRSSISNTPRPRSRRRACSAWSGRWPARRRRGLPLRPVLTALQLPPLLVLWKTPPPIGPGVERARRGRVDGQRGDVEGIAAQAGVDRAPAAAAVGALEDAAATGPGVERARRGRVDGQREDARALAQAGVDRAPAAAAVGALEDAAATGPGVERARRGRVDGQRGDVRALPLRPVLTALQLPPLLVLWKTPPPSVPA